ncbi:hypothetical protein BJ944DRAFT_229300 [Cunninghamella echinulata]|nr:hypothetical protein BJ944DRAFT_229300 [Cunninghamella echinulata]
MFFEATYLSSPQFSPISPDDSVFNDNFSLEEDNHSHRSQTEDQEKEEDQAEEETPVNHLVFIIHGIGQQTEQYGHFYEHVANLKETTRQVLQAKIPDHNVRIELVPIEWHRHLHDRVDSQFKRITLKSIPTIRLIENEYLADVLLYFSKDHGQAIIDNVTELFNTSYHNFIKKHPTFNGKIAILGYSLGGIVTWDILSHQREPITDDEKADYQKLNIKYSKLDFQPDYYFTLGSPVAAVLTIRNQSPVNYHPADSVIFENIYDSYDPLAYRLEPLYDDYFVDHPSVPVERSMPSSVPSFSFPSLPSLPASSIFSFFSWKMTTSTNNSSTGNSINNNDSNAGNLESTTSTVEDTNTDQTTIINENDKPSDNYSINKDGHDIPTNLPTNVSNEPGDEEETPNSIPTRRKKSVMTSVLQYFGKKNENNSNNNNSSTLQPSTSTSTSASSNGQSSKITKDDDIIKWDPLHEQVLSSSSNNSLLLPSTPPTQPNTKNHQVSQNDSNNGNNNNINNNSNNNDNDNNNNDNDDEDDDDKTVSLNISTNRLPLQRSVTYSDQRSLQNLVDNNDNNEDRDLQKNDNHTTTIDSPIPIEKDKINQERHHLVEVLGIDGVRIDSIERANVNFQRRQQQQQKRVSSNSIDDKSNDPKEYTQQDEMKNNKSTSNPQEQQEQELNNNNVDANDDDTQTKHTLEKLPGQRRIDYTLQQEGFMSMIANEYLVGLRAHFSYWASKDLLWHIVRRLENLDVTNITTTTQKGTGSSAPTSSSSSSSTTMNMSRKDSSDFNPTQLENSK